MESNSKKRLVEVTRRFKYWQIFLISKQRVRIQQTYRRKLLNF